MKIKRKQVRGGKLPSPTSPLLKTIPANEFRIHLFETDTDVRGRILVGDGKNATGGVAGTLVFYQYGDMEYACRVATEFCVRHGIPHVIVTKKGLKTSVQTKSKGKAKEGRKQEEAGTKGRFRIKKKRNSKVSKASR